MPNLIFTLEGAYAETRELSRNAFNAAFQACDVDWHIGRSEFAISQAQEVSSEDILLAAAKRRNQTCPDTARVLQSQYAHFLESLEQDKAPPRPGVVRLIDECLSKGLHPVILSAQSRFSAEILINRTFGFEGLRYIKLVAPVPDGPIKPLQSLWKRAAEAADLNIAITDSNAHLCAAKTEGCGVILTPSPLGGATLYNLADAAFSDLGTPSQPHLNLGKSGPECGFVTTDYLFDLAARQRSAA